MTSYDDYDDYIELHKSYHGEPAPREREVQVDSMFLVSALHIHTFKSPIHFETVLKLDQLLLKHLNLTQLLAEPSV